MKSLIRYSAMALTVIAGMILAGCKLVDLPAYVSGTLIPYSDVTNSCEASEERDTTDWESGTSCRGISVYLTAGQSVLIHTTCTPDGPGFLPSVTVMDYSFQSYWTYPVTCPEGNVEFTPPTTDYYGIMLSNAGEGDGGSYTMAVGAYDPNAVNVRINQEPGATVAIYCTAGGFDIWGIDAQGHGYPAISMTLDDIVQVPNPPAENLLVTSYDDIDLYRLTTGEWQVNRGPDFEGKTYVYIWRNCGSGDGYTASFSINDLNK